MCTLVVAFYPQSHCPLVIAANRDEKPDRPSEPWGLHNPGIFCPLDVRGGTWIGCNSAGIFCAITNWDIQEHTRGLMSRGNVVLETLKLNSKEDIFQYWRSLDKKNYNPFNILAGSKDWLANFSCSHSNASIYSLSAGLHVSTGWGLNVGVIREQHIRKALRKAFFNFSSPVSRDDLIKVMCDHNAGEGSEDSICVHDENHEWETRSSSYIEYFDDTWPTPVRLPPGRPRFLIRWTDGPPCRTTPEQWESFALPLYCPLEKL